MDSLHKKICFSELIQLILSNFHQSKLSKVQIKEISEKTHCKYFFRLTITFNKFYIIEFNFSYTRRNQALAWRFFERLSDRKTDKSRIWKYLQGRSIHIFTVWVRIPTTALFLIGQTNGTTQHVIFCKENFPGFFFWSEELFQTINMVQEGETEKIKIDWPFLNNYWWIEYFQLFIIQIKVKVLIQCARIKIDFLGNDETHKK